MRPANTPHPHPLPPTNQPPFRPRRYVPIGRVEEVLPYLIRRAQENSAILSGEAVAGEMAMLRAELGRRLGLTLQPPLPEEQ